ncbi:MAG TPA: hypothetical protein VMQ40_04295 [Acidimicrobiales bacterium]|nr:hypothetical protein [Acidimicrobiales bacterium]
MRGATARGRRAAVRASRAVVACGLVGVLAAVTAPSLASAVGPATFSPVATYTEQTNLPGDLSCLPTGFCMELAYGGDSRDLTRQATVSALASHDSGMTWAAVASPLSLGALQLGASTNETIDCVAAQTCFFMGQGLLLRTVDGGVAWHRIVGLAGVTSATVTCTVTAACLGVRLTRAGLTTYWLRPGSASFAKTRAPVRRVGAPTAIDCASASRCVVATLTGSGRASHTAIFVTSTAGVAPTWVRSPRLIADRIISSVSCPSVSLCMGVDSVASHVGPLGIQRIIRSNDGGATWSVVANAGGAENRTTFAPPESVVQCSTRDVCISSVGHATEGILRPTVVITSKLTTNGGVTWRSDAVAHFSFEPYLAEGAASCVTATACVADAGAEGYLAAGLVATSPDGRSWTPSAPPPNPVAATGLQCTTNATCYRIDTFESAAGYGGQLLESSDDGTTWRDVALPQGDEPVVFGGCQSSTTCELFALTGTALTNGLYGLYDYSASSLIELSTTNAWQTTTTTPVAGAGVVPLLASCTTTGQCVVLANTYTAKNFRSELLATTTGASWSSTRVNSQEDWLPDVFVLWAEPTSLSCSPSGTCLFADDNALVEGLMVSTNFGSTWSASMPSWDDAVVIGGASCTGASQCDVSYVDNSTNSAWLVDTTDGGSTWSAPVAVSGQPSKTPPFLSCADAMHCTVVQDSFSGQATAAQTSDAGASWSAIKWDAVALPKSGTVSSGGLLTCSLGACVVEAETLADVDGGNLAKVTFQLLDLAS